MPKKTPRTNAQMNSPCGIKINMLSEPPMVPVKVTASGLTFIRTSSFAGGSMMTAATLRAAGLLSIRRCPPGRYRPRRPRPGSAGSASLPTPGE